MAQIVTHLEQELKLKGLEAFNELQVKTLNQYATEPNSEKPKLT